MSVEDEKNLKIRFKFPSGEEFEAEGTREFIEEQRAYFLQLVGRDAPVIHRPGAPLSSYERTSKRTTFPLYPATPAVHTPSEITQRAHSTPTDEPTAGKALWEQILKTEDGLVLLRKKNRLVTHETAALILIAGAKSLLGAANGYSALDLSKSLKKSGYAEGRLDRMLGGEIRVGAILPVGSKRGRAYKLSDEGFARAFVVAEKISKEI